MPQWVVVLEALFTRHIYHAHTKQPSIMQDVMPGNLVV